MSNTIDNRTVQMEFDNKRFESGIGDSLKSIDSLKKGLNFTESAKSFEDIERSSKGVKLNSMGAAIDQIRNRFSILGIAGITIIQDLTRKILESAKLIAKTFVIDPIKSGFEEYELKLNSVQTIMAGTGEDLKTVTGFLNELNTYADKTIYSFSDMTTNIGKFTNAGVTLPQSVAAIKGIANAAALSGANAGEASRAMYNLAQALSAGYVKLLDWKSVEFANMGTVEFKQQLIDSAVAAGTLTDNLDGTYKTLTGNSLSATRGFNEALTDQWLSTEVLVETLNRYADTTTDIGKRATAAAQDVKTLTQLNDTLKEAAQSGWAQTWELMVGDFNEAKAFFTELSDIFGGLIDANADYRNDLVQTWKDLGGRDAALTAIRNTIEGILSVIKPVSEALKEIFPPITGKKLAELTTALAIISEKFKMAGDSADKIKRIFKGVFAIFDIGRMFVSALVKEILSLISSYSDVSSEVIDGAASLADWIVGLRDAIKESGAFATFLFSVGKGVKFVLDLVISLIGSIVGLFAAAGKTADTKGFVGFLSKVSEKLKTLGKFGEIVGKLLGVIVKLADKLAPILAKIGEKIGTAFNTVLDKMTEWIDGLDVDKVLDTINKGLFGAVLVSLTSFVNQSKKVIGGGLFAGILLSIKSFIDNAGGTFKGVKDILESVKGTLEAYQKSIQANTLLKIAAAIGLLALSIIALSFIDPDKLTKAMTAISIVFLELFASLEAFNKNVGGLKKTGVAILGLLAIASALLILSGALAILSKLDPVGLAVGLGAITVLLAEIGAFLKFAGSGASLATSTGAFISLSVGLLILAGTLKVFASMSLEEVASGLLAMGGSLAIIAGSLQTIPKDIAVKALGLVVISGALIILAKAFKEFSGLSWDELAVGLAGLAGTLTILAIALSAMSGTLVGAASLLVAAAAIGILAVSMKALSTLSLEQIGIALLAIAGAFTVLGLAGAILTPLIPSLLGLALAMALLGVAALAVGVGVSAFAIGLTAMAAAGAAGAAALGAIIFVIASALPFIAEQMGKAILAIITTISNGAPKMVEAFVKIGKSMVNGFRQMIPYLAETVLLVITTVLTKISEALPKIIQAGYDILISILKGIEDNIGEIIKTISGIIKTMLDAFAESLPSIIKSGHNLMIAFIDGMADSMEENIPRLMESVTRLAKAIVTGLVKGLFNARGEVVNAIRDVGNIILDEFKSVLGIHSPSDEFYDASGDIVGGLVGGIKHFAKNAYSTITDFGNDLVSKFTTVTSKISEAVNSEMNLDPTIRPVIDLSNISKGADKMKGLLDGSNLKLGVAIDQSRAIASDIQRSSHNQFSKTEMGTGENVNNAGVQFIQNNYSPKELSRYEIYRQTKNQLITAKGLVGAS